MELVNTTFTGCLQFNVNMTTLWIAIDVHSYLFGSLFLILIITACIALIPLVTNQPGSKAFIITINVLVIIFGIIRSLYLLIDAYALEGRFSGMGALLFEDLAIPCLTSAFALVQWAFLEVMIMRPLNAALQKPHILVTIVVGHFVFIAVLDVTLFYVGNEACFLNVVCQAVSVLWGIILTFGFLYTTQKLVKTERSLGLTLNKGRSKTRKYMSKVKYAGAATTIVGIVLFSTSLYGMIAVYNPTTDPVLGGFWGWYTFQTLQRILELCFGFIMVYLSMSRNRLRPRNRSEVPVREGRKDLHRGTGTPRQDEATDMSVVRSRHEEGTNI